MALISCPECGQAVSTDADSCPHCGYRMHSTRGQKDIATGCGIILFWLVTVPLIVCFIMLLEGL